MLEMQEVWVPEQLCREQYPDWLLRYHVKINGMIVAYVITESCRKRPVAVYFVREDAIQFMKKYA